jgi:ArsR family transcriptional regulator, arsenate/arsenite/antimonite-responsive transcriptional repressor
MKLIQIYECLCDETRLRILNLLSATPLCVSHLQKVLGESQVKMSKHLSYMKERGMVDAVRVENRKLYSISKESSAELENNLRCLQDCSKEYAIFKNDLKKLEGILNEVAKIKERICIE